VAWKNSKRTFSPCVIVQEDWQSFVKWFRSNGGIISSKLTVKVLLKFAPLRPVDQKNGQEFAHVF
jgi:hypothetical protein